LVVSIIHERREKDRPPAAPSRRPYRQAGPNLGRVQIALGVELPDGRGRAMSHTAMPIIGHTGSLPVTADMEGVGGERLEGDGWEWTIKDALFVSHSKQPLHCRIWLRVNVRDDVLGYRDLTPVPNDPLVLPPEGHQQVSLRFPQDLSFLGESAQLDPGPARELVMVEVGGDDREMRHRLDDSDPVIPQS